MANILTTDTAVSYALNAQGVSLSQLNRAAEALAVYDDVVARFGARTEPALLERVAQALVNKGGTLGELNRAAEALAIYDDVVARFGARTEPALLEPVARAHYNRACAYALLRDAKRSIAALEEMKKIRGKIDWDQIEKDKDFDPIRTDPSFLDFMKRERGTV
ncbi:MAG: hypothetical protein EXR11_12735 [Rhodospirillaceae bacterium]|nr:hypothetical protein [Rhodospirillaceae bacterium]